MSENDFANHGNRQGRFWATSQNQTSTADLASLGQQLEQARANLASAQQAFDARMQQADAISDLGQVCQELSTAIQTYQTIVEQMQAFAQNRLIGQQQVPQQADASRGAP